MKVPRVVFGVRVEPTEDAFNMTFEDTCEFMKTKGILYTIVKFGAVRREKEGKQPYRLHWGFRELPKPSQTTVLGSAPPMLSSGDLYRVISPPSYSYH